MRAPQGAALAFCALFGTVVAGAGGGAAAEQTPEVQAAESADQREGVAAQRRGTPGSRATAQPTVARHGGGGLSCVPYARMVSGIQVTGNGGRWWDNAAGLYARGQRPEPGSVMAFRSTGGMTRGHVAVVSRVHGPRHLVIDHANWAGPGIRRGTVMRDVNVIDVSDRNDWSAVRVQVGWDPYTYGRVYPTYGFIYNRADTRTMMAATGATPRGGSAYEEVAADPRAGATGSADRRTAAGGR